MKNRQKSTTLNNPEEEKQLFTFHFCHHKHATSEFWDKWHLQKERSGWEGRRASHLRSGACANHYLSLLVYYYSAFIMICVSLVQGPQHKLKNTLLCSVQAEVEHLHRAWSNSSHMFHVSPKIFLTIVVVHHCQHFHPRFNSDTSLNATIKHTCARNTFPTRLTYRSDFPYFVGLFFLQPAEQNLC